MKEEAKEWFEKAEKDLDDAIFNYSHEKNEVAGFLFHQAAEKALKAFQIEKTGEHDYSHDLLALSDGESRKKFKELFKELNPVYTGFRYPDVQLNIENLDEIRERSERFIKWMKKRLRK